MCKHVFGLIAVVGIAASVNAGPVTANFGGGGNGNNNPGNDAVLWDQSGFDPAITQTVDQEFGDFPTFSTYMVDDFTTGGQPWNVDSVSTYFTKTVGGLDWNNSITQGKLQVYNKSGNLPSNGDVPPEYKVTISLTDGGGFWIVNADTSGIAELQGINGDYWIGLTPVADFGVYGQEFHQRLNIAYGDQAAVRNPGGGFGIGTNWNGVDVFGFGASDMAFKLEGDIVPAPGAVALLGLGGLIVGRRRR